MGYAPPRYTQTPNLLLDEHLPDMSGAECKVVLAIVRQTFGWHKQKDQLSLSQLQELTGLSRQGVIDGLQAAMERGVVDRQECGQSYEYWLVVKNLDQGSQENRPAVVKNSDTQKKETKEKGSSGGARAGASMPDELLPLYDTYQPEIEAVLDELTPSQADQLVMQKWSQSSVGSTTIHLATEYEWPYFAAGVIVTANEAKNPNPRYLHRFLEAVTSLDERTSDNPTEEEQQSELQRLWHAAETA